MIAVLIAIIGREQALKVVLGPIEVETINFRQLKLPPKPNRFLVCPPEYCAANFHMASPVFAVSNIELRQRWIKLMTTQPRIEPGAADDQVMQYDFVQRSALMRYPDSITVRFIPLEKERSTLAIYSRSHYGYSDFGINEARIRAWLEKLERR